MSTFILIHGAWHGAWCWYKLVPKLEKRGHQAISIELPAHGIDRTPIKEIQGLDQYADSVCEVLDSLNKPVKLVGHSLGGAVITRVSERVPDKITELIFISGFLPWDSRTVFEISEEGEDTVLSQNIDIIEERGSIVINENYLKEALYSDCSKQDIRLAKSLLRPEPIEPSSDPIIATSDGFGSVQKSYIICKNDNAISPSHQRKMCEIADVDTRFEIETSHSPFLSAPRKTVDKLEQ